MDTVGKVSADFIGQVVQLAEPRDGARREQQSWAVIGELVSIEHYQRRDDDGHPRPFGRLVLLVAESFVEIELPAAAEVQRPRGWL